MQKETEGKGCCTYLLNVPKHHVPDVVELCLHGRVGVGWPSSSSSSSSLSSIEYVHLLLKGAGELLVHGKGNSSVCPVGGWVGGRVGGQVDGWVDNESVGVWREGYVYRRRS